MTLKNKLKKINFKQKGFTPTPTFTIGQGVSLSFISQNIFRCNFLHKRKLVRGFILPFAMILAYIILIISMGISDILTKEMYFSYIGRESQIAYYAADAGLDCATYLDAAFLDSATGIGVFPATTTDRTTWENAVAGQYGIAQATSISCTGSTIFDPIATGTSSGYTVIATDGNSANGVTATFMLHMYHSGSASDINNYGCALVSVEKKVNSTNDSITRRIISRGYNTCDTTSSKFVERAIINCSSNNNVCAQ